MTVSLTGRTLRGFGWAFAGSAGQAVLQVAATVVLARLLTPEQFGSVAAALLVVGLAQLLTQLGVSAAVVRRRELTDEDVAAAFGFSVLVSSVFAVGLATAAPVLSPLVGLAADAPLLPLLAPALVLAGVAAVPSGLLQRNLRFRQLTVVDLIAAGPAMIGVSVVLALAGLGADALALAEIAAALVTAVGYLLLARPTLRPLTPRAAWARLQPMIGFGSGYSLAQLGNWVAQNADNLVVAAALGTGALGVYSRAYNLLSEPASVIGGAADKVLFPAMARVRDEGERLRAAYVRSASLIAMVTVPASVLLCVLAPEVVRVLLGPRWAAVVVPLRVFALVLLPRTTHKISTSLTRATGAVYRAAWRMWLYAAEVVVFCWVGARVAGVDGVAVGAAVAIVAHFLVMLRFSARVSAGLVGATFAMYGKHLPALAATVTVTVGVAAAVRPLACDVLTLVTVTLAGTLAAAAVLVGLRGRFRAELGVLSHARR
ncbi:MAG TPA: lipopolysaccharide biosynthesis protein [Pseudonocardia sp.]